MNKTQKQALVAGAGLAAVAAAAAGVYFLTGKNAKNRKKIAKWGVDFKNDVVKELNSATKASKAGYHKVIDNVAKNYQKLSNVEGPELMALVSELKDSWDSINSQVSEASKKVSNMVGMNKPKTVTAKKVVTKAKTAVKKVAKKATAKK